MGFTLVTGFGTVFTAISLLLVAVSFATDHWINYTVDRVALKGVVLPAHNISFYTVEIYYSRDRGLFRTCFDGDETQFLDGRDDIVDNVCIEEKGYELTPVKARVNWGDDYDIRKHLMRCHVAFFICAMLLLVIGCIVGSVGCWYTSGRILRAAGLCVFFAAFFTAGGMGMFHGYEYLEKQKIDQILFPKYWRERLDPLENYSDMDYGFSYILGWVGTGAGCIAAILFLCAANYADVDEYEEEKAIKKKKPRSRAYDYMMEPQPAMQPAMPVVMPYSEYPPPGSQVGYAGPYAEYGAKPQPYPQPQYAEYPTMVPMDVAYRY